MNFNQTMNWILGRNVEPVAKKVVDEKKERRVSLRLDFAEGVAQIEGYGDFQIIDLSQGGLSFAAAGASSDFSVGDMLPARIRLASVFFENELQVCSVRNEEIGCSFTPLPLGHARILNEFLKPRRLGGSIREIRATEKNLRYFQGDEETQIMYWTDAEGNFASADFYFMNYLVTINGKENSLRTAFVQTPFLGGTRYGVQGQGTLIYHDTPSYRALKIGHLILNHSSLPEEIFLDLGSIMFREEKCTFSRVILGEHEKNIDFAFTDEQGDARLKLISLCSNAFSALLPDMPPKRTLPPGTVLEGKLKLPDREILATLKVIFQQDFVIGGSLKIAEETEKEFFASFLVPRLLGKSLEASKAPAEAKPFAPDRGQATLYVGIHNTHLLSLLVDEKLFYGRLVFGNSIILFEKNKLTAFSCDQGIVCPSDWEIIANPRERIVQDSPELINAVREILTHSAIKAEVLKAWENILPRPSQV